MDEIDKYLTYEVHLQEYARKIIKHPIEEVSEVNKLSIKSIRQRVKNENDGARTI